jgi:hypothetical protein
LETLVHRRPNPSPSFLSLAEQLHTKYGHIAFACLLQSVYAPEMAIRSLLTSLEGFQT